MFYNALMDTEYDKTHPSTLGATAGARIKALRQRRGLSLGQLAERLKRQGRETANRGYLSKLENGEVASPGSAMLEAIAVALGVGTSELTAPPMNDETGSSSVPRPHNRGMTAAELDAMLWDIAARATRPGPDLQRRIRQKYRALKETYLLPDRVIEAELGRQTIIVEELYGGKPLEEIELTDNMDDGGVKMLKSGSR